MYNFHFFGVRKKLHLHLHSRLKTPRATDSVSIYCAADLGLRKIDITNCVILELEI